MGQNTQRRHYMPDQKFKIIKEQMTTKAELCKIEELEKKNTRMQSVITEIVQENIELKKSLGDWGFCKSFGHSSAAIFGRHCSPAKPVRSSA